MEKYKGAPTEIVAGIICDNRGKQLWQVIDAENGIALLTTTDYPEALEIAVMSSIVSGHDIFYGKKARKEE